MQTPSSAERITKVEAARRQLRTAVTLFFQNGDNVSIHTLVAAAHEVLFDLLKHEGKTTRMEQRADLIVKPEFHDMYRRAVRRAQNFFKHANKKVDPATALDFDPRQTHYILIDCFEAYMLLTGRSLRELWMFFAWFTLEYPDVLEPSGLKDAVLGVVGDGSAPHHDRAAFMNTFDHYAGPAPHLD